MEIIAFAVIAAGIVLASGLVPPKEIQHLQEEEAWQQEQRVLRGSSSPAQKKRAWQQQAADQKVVQSLRAETAKLDALCGKSATTTAPASATRTPTCSAAVPQAIAFLVCAECGAPLIPGARFCDECGRQLPAKQLLPAADPTTPAVSDHEFWDGLDNSAQAKPL